MKRIGILGSGVVGKTLAAGYTKKGYEVKIGTRDPQKLSEWAQGDGQGVSTGSFSEVAEFGELIILAVKGTAAESVLEAISPALIEGKTIMDATNPISNETPENGVLRFFTDQNGSLMEDLQRAFPKANFVKAFNSVGSHFMVNPGFAETPTMFICGNNENARSVVRKLVEELGWEVEDMGMAEAARAIEPLCMLWCIPGFRENKWAHAFKLLKANN